MGFAQSTESPRKEGSCVDGAVPRHSIEFALDISLAPTRLQGPLSPRSSSQKTFSYARARRVLGMHAIDLDQGPGGSDKLSQLRNNHMTFWYPITFRFRLARACVYTVYRVSISHLDCTELQLCSRLAESLVPSSPPPAAWFAECFE